MVSKAINSGIIASIQQNHTVCGLRPPFLVLPWWKRHISENTLKTKAFTILEKAYSCINNVFF